MSSPCVVAKLVLRRIKKILIHDTMDMTRLGLTIGSFLWGIQLLLPVTLFPTALQIAEGKGRMTYSLMALVASETVWGLLFVFQACWAAYALFSMKRDKLTLLFDGVLGCALWTGSTVACFIAYWPKGVPVVDAFLAYPSPAAMSGEAIMALYSWWHMVRHWADYPRSSTFFDCSEYK